MRSSSPLHAFACESCHVPSVSVIGPLEPDAIVTCGECGRPLTTWAVLLDSLIGQRAAMHGPGSVRLAGGPGEPVALDASPPG